MPRPKNKPWRSPLPAEYAGFGPALAAEYLQQRDGIHLGPRNAARLEGRGRAVETPPAQAGTSAPVASPAPFRGELVQWDTSEHGWLEGRGEKLYLIGMIDDARSELLARFVRHDSSE